MSGVGHRCHDFRRSAADREGEHQIAGPRAAEIAMNGFRRVEEEGRRAGGAQGGGAFQRHLPGLADADRGDLATAIEDMPDGCDKAFRYRHGGDGGGFALQNLADAVFDVKAGPPPSIRRDFR